MNMKRVLLAIPFVLAACGGSMTEPREGVAAVSSSMSAKGEGGTCTVPIRHILTRVPVGFDANGYNRCAHIFVGTFEGYCADRGQGPECGEVLGSTKLVMKWNEEWDRGNAEWWLNGPYSAYIDNEVKGVYGTSSDPTFPYPRGTPFSEHFKARWDAGCDASGGVSSTNGGGCIWGPFEVLMDQGSANGSKVWWAKLTPAGYGN
jgi:hypothetical protein